MITQITGSVAHDFNNVLSAILGSAELMKIRAGNQPNPLLDDIIRASEHASMLTRQLLAFSRRRPETPKVHDLRLVVTDFTALVKRLAGVRIRLTTEVCDEDVPVEADRGNIEQVLFNLVTNAKDAITGEGEIRIEVSIGKGRNARLTVSDTGAGIAADKVPYIFEPFFTTQAEGRGTGLGLVTIIY